MMSPKAWCPPAQAEELGCFGSWTFQGASREEPKGSGRTSRHLHTRIREAGSHQKAQAKAHTGTFFFFFWFYYENKTNAPGEGSMITRNIKEYFLPFLFCCVEASIAINELKLLTLDSIFSN